MSYKIIGGVNINPKKTYLRKINNIFYLNKITGFFKWNNIDLRNKIILLEKIEEDTKHGAFKKAGWTLIGDLALGGIGTLAGLVFGGKRKQICVHLKTSDDEEILFTCTDKEYFDIYNFYLNYKEKEDLNMKNQNFDNITLSELKDLKDNGIISEQEYKENSRKLLDL